MIEPVLPLLIQSVAGTSLVSSTVGTVIAIGNLAAAISALAVGRFVERWKYKPVLLWAAVGACIAATPLALASTVGFILVLVVALGLFQGALRAANSSYVGLTIPTNRRGVGYGTATSLSSTGGALGPLLAGAIAAVAGIPSAFFALSLVFMSIAVWIGKRVVEPIESASG
jgi:MFS family permease